MKVNYLGTQHLDFVPKDKSESDRVQGVKLWFCFDDSHSRNWTGKTVDSIFVRASDPLYDLAKVICNDFEPIYEYVGRYPRLVDFKLSD